MGCSLWRCDTARCCMNEMICDDILCIRFLRHDCDTCDLRDGCHSFARAKMLRLKENEKESIK